MRKTETEENEPRPTAQADEGEKAANPQTEPVATISTATISPEQLEDLKQQAAKADDHWNRLLRTVADFDNFKKRAAREKAEAIKYANEALLEKLMPVMDSFDMALAASQNVEGAAPESFQTGVSLIFQQFKTVLQEAGLETVDALGKPFDPNLHEAVAMQDAADVPESQVIQQIRKGYKLRERLLRPAAVIVARKPSS